MINLDALHKAKKTKLYIIKEAPNIKLWTVVPYDSKQYYVITIEVDDSTRIKVIEQRRLKALRLYKKAVRKRSKV